MDATSRSRARRSRRDSIAIDRRERDTIDHAVGRSSIVGAHATSIGSDQIDLIEVAVDRAIEVERAFECIRETPCVPWGRRRRAATRFCARAGLAASGINPVFNAKATMTACV